MNDLIATIEQVVNGLDGLPGVELPPGAPEEQIHAAHRAIGVKLPPDHSLIALLSDGITLFHGLERYLPFDPASRLNIVRFNDPTTWQWAYADFHPEVLEFVYFAILWSGDVLGYRRSDLENPGSTPPRVHVVVPRAPTGVFPSARAAIEALRVTTDSLRRTGELTLNADDAPVLEMHGPLPPDTILMPGPRNLIEDDGSLEGSVPMDAIDALIAIGELTGQLRKAPEAAQIAGMEHWLDELGRTRLRWRIG